jgi:hypothetical protein
MTLYKAKDAMDLRNMLQAAVTAALQEVMKSPLHVTFKSSSVMHTDLQPSGDMFTINLVAEVHPKKEKQE